MSPHPPGTNARKLISALALALIPSLLLCGAASSVLAEEVATEEWNISADRLIRFENPDSIIAEGNVVLEKKERLPANPPPEPTELTSWDELLGETSEEEEQEVLAEEVLEVAPEPRYRTTVTIRADWIAYDVELETIKAKGNVDIVTGEDRLRAKEGTVQLSTETGKFSQATVNRQENSLHLEGESIEKTGLDTYRIVDGWAITCKVEEGKTPPWSFASADTDIRQGGYAVLKHARFNIHGVPVLYSPYLILPVKNTRQTGFLFPEISNSTNSGFGFNLPFFLNLSDSADLTFFPEYYQKRGFMPGLEFRLVTSASDKMTLTGSYLDDKLSDPSETEYYADTGYTHDNSERYWLRGKADNDLNGWQTRADLDIVSDQDYLREFNTGYTGFKKSHNRYLNEYGRGFENETNPLRQNSFKVLNNWEGMSLEANLLAVNDSRTDAPDNDTPLWKLPGVDFTGAIPLWETDFTLDWNTNYVNYWREDGIGGHRADLKPTISTPVRISPYLESRAAFSLRETYYLIEEYGEANWDNDDTQNRLVPEGTLEVASTWERDFSTGASAGSGFTHQLRPFMNYSYIPDIDQKDLPSFDDKDFVGERNAISYGIDNFFNLFNERKGLRQTGREYATFRLEQAYDLRDEASDEPFGQIHSRLTLRPVPRSELIYKNYYHVYDNDFTSHNFEGIYSNSRGDSISLDYSYKDQGAIEQVNATVLTHLVAGWLAEAGVEHSLSEEETIRSNVGLTYQAPCWSVKFETFYTPEETTYMVLFNLANIGLPFGIEI